MGGKNQKLKYLFRSKLIANRISIEILMHAITRKIRDTGLIAREYEPKYLTDEPRIPAYVCFARNEMQGYDISRRCSGFGTNRSPKLAQMLAYAECLEHFCLDLNHEEFSQKCAYDSDQSKIPAENFICSGFADDKYFHLVQQSEYAWWPVQEIISGAKYSVPAQTIFTANALRTEIQIRGERNSSGAAFGELGTNRAAISGLLELIERDAKLGAFLTRLQLKRVVKLPKSIAELVEYIERYQITLHIFVIESEFGLPTFLSLAIDQTPNGFALTTGAATNFDFRYALEKAILEAMQSRVSRRFLQVSKRTEIPDHTEGVHSSEDRMLFWSCANKLHHLDFWTDGSREVEYNSLRSKKLSFSQLIDKFGYLDIQIYVADLTIPELRSQGLEVKKVLVPELLQMHTHEHPNSHSFLRRGKAIGLNTDFPHPFV